MFSLHPLIHLKGNSCPLQHFLIKLKTLGWETVFTLSAVVVLGFCSSDSSCPKWICCFSCERIFLRCSKDKLCTQFETPHVQCKNLLHKCWWLLVTYTSMIISGINPLTCLSKKNPFMEALQVLTVFMVMSSRMLFPFLVSLLLCLLHPGS